MRYVLAILLLITTLGAVADDQEPLKTGIFKAEFDERSPLSDPDRMSAVAGWQRESMPAYDIDDHAFQLVVPKAYDGSEPYGLLVFIHPNNDISLDRFYGRVIREVLAKHKLIWVSYSGAGNAVLPNIRMGLALDAVHNASKRYNIDGRRVYLSGLSGGGRMTCMAGLYYPQVFRGAIPIVGTLYFRDVNLPDDPDLLALMKGSKLPANAVWRRGLIPPRAKALREMKKNQRWVLLAGEKDFNMPQMRAHFEQGFERDAFEYAHYLEVKGMGHTYPDAKWFEQAIEKLDQPIAKQEPDDKPPADERTQRLAQRRLEVALRALQRDRERGVRALQRLIDELPNTDAAGAAREKLKTLDAE